MLLNDPDQILGFQPHRCSIVIRMDADQATSLFEMTNYALWAIGGVLAGLIALAVTAAGNLLIDRRNCRALLSRGKAVR